MPVERTLIMAQPEKGNMRMRITGACLATWLIGWSPAVAQLSFQGKTVTMIIGFAAGGGTDAYGRLAAGFFSSYLPGQPNIVPRNIPGAEGITAMNYIVQQVAPDGYTIVACSSTTADPLNYRKPQSHYDARSFGVIGGVGRGGSVLIINKDAEPRLRDKAARPVIMGAPGGIPRSGMQMTVWGNEFLGWNTKWVVGYRGTNELMLALERGEIDMTSTANLFLIEKLVASRRFKLLVQTGTLKNGGIVPRPDFGDAPILANLLAGKIRDPVAQKAFDYWQNIASMDKWLALPPATPKAMLEVYRVAYGRMVQDPEFLERGKKTSDDFEPMSSSEVGSLVNALGDTPPAAFDYATTLLRKQGLSTE
jgi:tripartite-type tricarboxylate transporter receptor subunit TctC